MKLYMPKEDYTKLGYWKNINLYRYFKETTEFDPDKIAVVDGENKYSYKELNMRIQYLAGALKNIGISKGDVVSFQLPNWVESVVIFQAVAMIGAIANPIISIYRQSEMKYILNESESKVLFIPHTFRGVNHLEMIRSIKEQVPSLKKVIVLDRYKDKPALYPNVEEGFSEFANNGPYQKEIVSVDEKTILLLLYTSGTTSTPKGVLHSHNTLSHEVRNSISSHKYNEKDVFFVPSPVGHITGVLSGLILPFVAKGKVVFQDIWNQKHAIELLIREECTVGTGATPFLKGILNVIKEQGHQTLKLRVFTCGGTDVPSELIIEASKTLSNCLFKRSYGSSEHPTVTGISYKTSLENASSTDGKVLKGNKIKIINEYNKEVPIGTVGQIVSKGPDMFLGYIQNEFNKDSFLEDGYFVTGDLATIDRDGYINVKGRIKDIIIRGGENISVKEVEELLGTHPKISNVAIVAMPDEAMGEKACAYIELNANEKFTFSEMTNFLIEKEIAKQKLPERLEIIEKMPLTLSGKIQKYKLRKDINLKYKKESKKLK